MTIFPLLGLLMCYETDFSDVTTSTHGKGLLCSCKNNLCNIPIITTPVEGSSSKSQPLKTENALIPIPTPQKPETPLANVIKTDVSITKTPFYNVAHVKHNNKHHIMAKNKPSTSGVPAKFGTNLVFTTCTFVIIYYF
uniref:Uncharacterized protein n=1 Tax=Acrobeloides nanus TaxID=290746 RepID=A0A914EDG3_9BILA